MRQERLKRLDELLAKVGDPDPAWTALRARLAAAGDVECAEKKTFLAAWSAAQEEHYVARIQALPAAAKAAGTAWLQRIVEAASGPAGQKAQAP